MNGGNDDGNNVNGEGWMDGNESEIQVYMNGNGNEDGSVGGWIKMKTKVKESESEEG